MSARKKFWVRHESGSWVVKFDGRVLSTHTTKTNAITGGVTVATANQPSSLLICRIDGTIDDERTYGDFPPRG